MYLTHSPCTSCAKLIVNADISHVIFDVDYRDIMGLQILTNSGIEVNRLSELIFTT